MGKRKDLFEAVKPFAPDGKFTSNEQVAMVNQLADLFGLPKEDDAPPRAARAQTALADNTAFFNELRKQDNLYPGAIGDDAVVAGFNAILVAMGSAGWPIAYAAYAIATAYHETNRTMQPVREAYWLSEEWRRRNLRYYPWYGRGYVQLTWERNYRKADAELGLGGKLIADADLAMQPDHAAQIMVRGMEQGWFTTKKLSDYLPSDGRGDFGSFREARRIINGTDKWDEIAQLALKAQAALYAGGWK